MKIAIETELNCRRVLDLRSFKNFVNLYLTRYERAQGWI
jgi:hypothetical protein